MRNAIISFVNALAVGFVSMITIASASYVDDLRVCSDSSDYSKMLKACNRALESKQVNQSNLLTECVYHNRGVALSFLDKSTEAEKSFANANKYRPANTPSMSSGQRAFYGSKACHLLVK